LPDRLWIPVGKDAPPGADEAWTLLAVGDFCPAHPCPEPEEPVESDGARWAASDLAALVDESDLAAVNLEGPISGAGEPIPKNGPSLAVDESYARDLAPLGFDVALLANNHILDFGPEALERTLDGCAEEGLAVCGAGANREEALRPAVLDAPDGSRVAFLSACEHEFCLASEARPGAAALEWPEFEDAVRAARGAADVVVVAAHGGCEHVPFPPAPHRARLRRLAAAGADLVLGNHPHVAQGWERRGGTLVFFSLGNFYFPELRENPPPGWNWSIAVRAHFERGRLLGAEAIPLESRDRIARVTTGEAAARRLAYLEELAAKTSGDAFGALWAATAKHLWKDRRGHFASSRPAFDPDAAAGVSGKKLAQARLRLLNLLRCEAHRWAVSTHLAALSGDEPNLVTPQVEADLAQLLDRMKG